MATRPRTSGTVAGRTPQVTGRPVYEDFDPKFEWREEPTANFLSVSLPGFVKEQIKVTYDERPRTVKVRGERPLGTNKFSRFSKDFSIPENCKPGEIRGKFERGTLVLTLPKQTITPVPPEEAPPPKVRTQKQSLSTEREPKSPKAGQQNVPPMTTSSGNIGKTKIDDKVVAGAKEAVDQAKHQKGQEDPPPKATSSKASDPTPQKASRVEPQGAASNVMSDRAAYGVGEGLAVGAKEKGDRPTVESQTTKKPKDQQQTPRDKPNKTSSQNEDDAQRNGVIEVSRKNNTGAGLDDDRTRNLGIPKAISGKKVIETENLVGAAKRAVKGLTTGLNEDRQLVVNVGVAIVVIVALGAYLSYKYGSSTRAEN
ncbi:inactive protein RESTRICTED TEV MOVEMENT 2-like [Rhodamnia argentea]|uniref:Inactive protein RESTRICTED TEV MOVEMENT 2-like n=1 Tax=Rhodamnia argentea TaxID=178133 RepID=A0A8B8Q7V3_9MYRT|nr:inactive protein RESTRICTED TEV MOVEMENT 2-like [Rhodamnia argentea]